MSKKNDIIAALELKQNFGLIPTFELEFQLTEELLGKKYHKGEDWLGKSKKEKEKMAKENAELYVEVAEKLGYYAIMETYAPDLETRIETIKEIKKIAGEKYFLLAHGDATYGIPFRNVEEYCCNFLLKPDEMKENAKKAVKIALEEGKKLLENGLDGFALCSDYCDNRGLFLGPKIFKEFIYPYLCELVEGYKKMGAYVIKHTDGNIMYLVDGRPVIEYLIDSGPHAIHSLDPTAGVDIREIREKYGNKVCLIGNVDCTLLHRGTREDVRKSCEYALKYGMPKKGNNPVGGYIYSTSNVVFKAKTEKENEEILDKYLNVMLKLWREKGEFK